MLIPVSGSLGSLGAAVVFEQAELDAKQAVIEDGVAEDAVACGASAAADKDPVFGVAGDGVGRRVDRSPDRVVDRAGDAHAVPLPRLLGMLVRHCSCL